MAERLIDTAVLGELKAHSYFHQAGYHVFKDTSGKAPVDLVIMDPRDYTVKRVEVKTCTHIDPRRKHRTYTVSVRRTRHNRSRVSYRHADPSQYDLLFVYFPDINGFKLFESKDIRHNKSGINVREVDILDCL